MSHITLRTLFVGAILMLPVTFVFAQKLTPNPNSDNGFAASKISASENSGMDEVRRQLREQHEEIEQLRAALAEQSRLINELRAHVERTEQATPLTSIKEATYTVSDVVATDTPHTSSQSAPRNTPQSQLETRVGRIEEQAKKNSESLARQLGSISFSGDIRLRYEGIFGQLNALPNSANPAVIGNELTARNRGRLRARLAMRGQIGKEFDWGLRFSTGSSPDVTTSNQTLTDFFAHKPFGLDQAYITYRPAAMPGLRLQGGKFETPWLFTEMTWDVDNQPEGINETYTRNFKSSTLKNLTFVAWQLPLLEQQSAFVRGASGKIDLDQSRRAGRDLALYGAQMRARFEPNSRLALTLSAADLYFSGTQFVTPHQFFGNQLQLPLTVTLPPTATTPAQTITGQATITRDLLVSGNGNLGLTLANNNAINRDGRLASGYNLVDLIGRLDLTNSKRFPIALLFNFVTNTQTHGVVADGAGGTIRLLRNHESNGYWAEIQIGKTQEHGDFMTGYTFTRIEKDAVLTPFNFSDIAQQSDIRAHRFVFAYAADPRVVLSLTGIITQRPSGLLGAFGVTPPGSLNRPTTRLQLDTIFRF